MMNDVLSKLVSNINDIIILECNLIIKMFKERCSLTEMVMYVCNWTNLAIMGI